jgi:hypothetical protein
MIIGIESLFREEVEDQIIKIQIIHLKELMMEQVEQEVI